MSERLRKIRLYGKLGAQFGREHWLAVSSIREATIAMAVVIPGFERYVSTSAERGEGYAIFLGKKNVGEAEIDDWSGNREIRIAPIIMGSKQGGLFQIVVGVVLLVVGFFTGGSTWGPAMMLMGGALAVSGAMSMMTQQAVTKESGDRGENVASKNFNGPVNTVAQGNPVPILYGRLIVGSAVISAGIYPEDKQ